MRIFLVFVFCFVSADFFSQTYAEIKNRFDKYVNYHGSLDKYVEISTEKIMFYSYVDGVKKTDFVLPKNAWLAVAESIKFLPDDSLEKFYVKLKDKQNFDVYGEAVQEKK